MTDFGNKEVHGDARAAFQMPTSRQHLFRVTGRPDTPLSVPSSGEGKRAAAWVARGDYGAYSPRI